MYNFQNLIYNKFPTIFWSFIFHLLPPRILWLFNSYKKKNLKPKINLSWHLKSVFSASAPNLVCYTWPVVCVFTKRSLGMSLSSSYQFSHGSVIKFCQFPCSAVFVVNEMTCTLGGKSETALYSLGVSICKQPLWMRFEPKQGWALWLGTTTSPRPPHS